MPAPTRPLRWMLAVALSGSLVAAACSSDSEGSSSEPTEPAGSTTDLPEGTEDLVGKWAHFDTVSYEDDVLRTIIISTGFSNLEMRDGELWNIQEFCSADTVTDQENIEVSISDAATSAIIPVETPVEVTEVDGQLRVVRPETPTAIGIDLEDPANEELPTDPDDPRINDADGDGNPGVTSKIVLGPGNEQEIYIARREIFLYDVTQVSADRMEGMITDSSEQLIVGASDELFAAQTAWEQIDNDDRDPVIWIRVDDEWDCEKLAAERDDLFPPNPVTDW